ncbi:MAG: PDZ domain-containing protein [Saprospiraceae bacterium]
MSTLLRYPTLLFLLLSTTMLFAAERNDKRDHEREDRCELKGFFGVTHDEPDRDKLSSLGYDTDGGTIVTNVVGCTGALNAGIQPMDYLYEVNGKTTSRSNGFFCLMSEFDIGESFQVGLIRKGVKKTVSVTLGRKSDACQSQTPFPKRGFFGINDTESDDKPGVLLDVSSSGPIAQLGLEDGDRLLRINSYPISDWGDLSTIKRLISDTDNVTFEVVRDGKDVSVTGAIPEEQHHNNDWNNSSRNIFAECADEIEDAFDEIDFDEIEREIESAIRSSDIREETEDAVEEVMKAVREVFGGVRTRGNNWDDDNDRTPDIDPSDMDARVEPMSESDLSQIEDFESDMPKNRDLVVNDFSASPNPNQGRFRLTFELPSKGDTRIAIYSAAGREVYAYDLGEYSGLFTDELDIMRNGPGTYFLVVRQDRQAFVRKLVLVRR